MIQRTMSDERQLKRATSASEVRASAAIGGEMDEGTSMYDALNAPDGSKMEGNLEGLL